MLLSKLDMESRSRTSSAGSSPRREGAVVLRRARRWPLLFGFAITTLISLVSLLFCSIFAGKIFHNLIILSKNLPTEVALPMKLAKQTTSCQAPSCRLEFIHIPKTGGTAIETAAARVNISWSVCHFIGSELSMRNSRNITKCPDTAETRRKRPAPIHSTPPWHLPSYYFADENGHYQMFGDPYANAILFTVVRDPYERAVSQYLYTREELAGLEADANHMNVFLGEALGRLQKFVPLDPSLQIQPQDYYTNLGHFIPQYDFVYDRNNKRIVEHVLHFENLSDEFPALMNQYNLSNIVLAEKTLGRHSRNKNRLGVEHLSLTNLRLIEKIYRRDFEAFGYASSRSLIGNPSFDSSTRTKQTEQGYAWFTLARQQEAGSVASSGRT